MEEQDAAKPTSERHVPVLKDRCINLLAPGFEAARSRGETPVAIDATLGMGGHSEAMLQRFPDLHLVGIDRDEEALSLAGARLEPFRSALTLFTPSMTRSRTCWLTSEFRRSTAS